MIIVRLTQMIEILQYEFEPQIILHLFIIRSEFLVIKTRQQKKYLHPYDREPDLTINVKIDKLHIFVLLFVFNPDLTIYIQFVCDFLCDTYHSASVNSKKKFASPESGSWQRHCLS
jgi:hypothetical protein